MKKISVLIAAAAFLCLQSFAQPGPKATKAPNGWHLLDPATTGYSGISLDKAYSFLKSTNKKSNQIIVAVIDSGVDTAHEDLKPILWTNPKEIPGNGIDDDHNGYVDDVHGWNFLGGKDGRNVTTDSYEAARVYYAMKDKWEGKDSTKLSPKELVDFRTYEAAKEKTVGEVNPLETAALSKMMGPLTAGDLVIQKELGKTEYNGNDLKTYTTSNKDAQTMKDFLVRISDANKSNEISNAMILEQMNGEMAKAKAATTPPPNYRNDITGDDPNNLKDRNYGNNDIMTTTSLHGTHCSGIIGAVRNNGIGMNGVADNVRIMMVRAVPDGDEHDKDIANAIHYAVDNGARVISMSFGKDFSPQKEWVDDAFKYAASKNVLLVHAAGNDKKDLDIENNFPSTTFLNGGRADNVITVGASGDKTNGGLTASFSNYGKHEVDVFAPGVNIYSTLPGGDKYGNLNGTSMATPVVAGVAALILEYYPTLTPQQVKMAIEKSAVAPAEKVKVPGTKEMKMLSDISVSGGLLNAYEAVKYASTIATNDNIQKMKMPKSKVKKIKKG